jgi:4-diphosphocytidyl-2-C-methyl-D-erythritol kinase
MSWEIAVSAPAKVNLHLEILCRRADGYHDLVSLFQAVSLFDEIRIRRGGRAGSFLLTGDAGTLAKRNSISRAISVFRTRTGCREGLVVDLKKIIPIGGGLGGGSSDAAAVLLCLRRLLDPAVSIQALLAMAVEVGSDVPFFLQGPTAVVEGRGDRIRPIEGRKDFALVALFPGAGVGTPEAYRWLDEDGRARRRRLFTADRLIERYRSPVADWGMSNDFDPVVFKHVPLLGGLRDRMAEAGALSPRLTGSGGTLIGVFPDASSAGTCARNLAGHEVDVLRPLAKMPAVR